MMAGWIRTRREGPLVHAWIWWGGQFFAASILLPPFVVLQPDLHAGVINAAKDKAADELAAMFSRVVGVNAAYFPLLEKKSA